MFKRAAQRLIHSRSRLVTLCFPIVVLSPVHAAAAQPYVHRYDLDSKPPAEWRVRPRPLLQLGGSSNVGPAQFINIVATTRMSDGSIVVADEGAVELRHFSATGQFLGLLMKKGNGPREIDHLHTFFPLGDTVVVARGRIGVHVIGLGDATERRLVLPEPNGWVRGITLGALNSENVLITLRRPHGQSAGNYAARFDSMSVGSFSLRDSSISVLATLPGEARYALPESQRAIHEYGFTARPLVASAPGRVCVGFSARYAIRCLDARGREVFRIERNVRARSVTHDARQAFRSSLLRTGFNGSQRATGSLLAYRQRVASAAKFASTFPAFSQLMIARTGELWVRHYELEDGLSTRSMRSNNSPSRWSIYDSTGRWIADCTLPRRFAPAEVARDYVLGVRRDDDDVETVTLFSLDRRSPER